MLHNGSGEGGGGGLLCNPGYELGLRRTVKRRTLPIKAKQDRRNRWQYSQGMGDGGYRPALGPPAVGSNTHQVQRFINCQNIFINIYCPKESIGKNLFCQWELPSLDDFPSMVRRPRHVANRREITHSVRMLVRPNSSKHAGKKGTSSSVRSHSVKTLRLGAGLKKRGNLVPAHLP